MNIVDLPASYTIPAKPDKQLLSSISTRSNTDFGTLATELAVEVNSRF